jgi:hypothetical protein
MTGLLNRLDRWGWRYVTRRKSNRKLDNEAVRSKWPQRYGQGHLHGVGHTVLVVKDGHRYWGTHALRLTPRAVNAHYSYRQHIEETFRLLKPSPETRGRLGQLLVSKTTSALGPFALRIVCAPLNPTDSLCQGPDDLCVPPVVICPTHPAKSLDTAGVC